MSGRGAFITKCRGENCGAKIRIIRLSSGKYHPVEVDPVTAVGGETIIVNGRVIVNAGAGMRGDISHFAKCPDAKKFRKIND